MSVPAGTKDDVTLLRLAAAGDVSAFEDIVTRHEASVYRFVRTLTSDVPRAEDALQETFLAAWRAAGTFRRNSSVRTWLFAIARHAVERQEQTAIVRNALDALGLDDRRVLVLRDLEGLDGEETAEVLGVSVAAVKSRLHRARLRFPARLREEAPGGR